MNRFHGLWLLVPFCLTLFLRDLDTTDLWSSHEARAAQNAQCMLDGSSWGLPRLYDGQVELQKPPAFYWLVAGTASLEGGRVDRWAVRLPSAIAALLTVISVWFYLTAQGRPLAGLIAGTVLASTIHFTSLARTGRIDMALTFAITATLLLLAPIAQNGRFSNRWMRTILAALTLALAILLKGPIGLALPIATMSIWLAFRRVRDRSADRSAWISLAASAFLGAILASPWFIWVNEQTHGEFVRVFFWYHNVERAMGEAPALAVYPWWYYLPRFTLDFLPWTPVLIASIAVFFTLRPRDAETPPLPLPETGSGTPRRDDRIAQIAQFGLVWLATMVGLLSLASFKRADYLLPAYPGAAILVGCVAEQWYFQRSHAVRRVAAVFLMVMMTGSVAGWWWFHHHVEPKQQAVREQKSFADHIRSRAPAPGEVLLFRVESHLLAYHLGRPIHTLVEWGELNQRLAEPGTHRFVTRAEFVPECLENVRTRRIEVDCRSEDFTAAHPLRPLVLMRTIDEQPSCPNTLLKD